LPSNTRQYAQPFLPEGTLCQPGFKVFPSEFLPYSVPSQRPDQGAIILLTMPSSRYRVGIGLNDMETDAQLKLAMQTPYYHHLGIEVVDLEQGFARLTLEFKEYLTHPFGYFHGGAIASLADSAGINAVLTTLNENENAVTLEMKINFLAPMKDAGVIAEARVIHRGRRSAVSDVEVHSRSGIIVAKAIITCAIF
jgi:acyl-CoA thioesterase